ncbi:MAG: amidohydrolase family protein [Bacillota bacterium]|nr:amidohydrolase family protein [Bacillota bacterium]
MADTLTIDAAAIWTGNKGQVIRDARLVTKGNTIMRVGSRAEFPDVEGQYVDFSQYWIVPGLIDVHAHLVFGDQGRRYEDYIREDGDDLMLLRAARNAQTHLAAGVTTLRDCGGRNNVVVSLRSGISRGLLEGPTIVASGRPLTITGGHFWWCNQECDGVEGVRQACRQLIKNGVDFFKIMASGGGTKGTDAKVASFTVEEIKAATDIARNHGMRTTAHCEATASVERAIAGGIHCVEHAGFQEPDGTRTYRPDLVEQMVEKGIYYSPTIQTAFGGVKRYSGRTGLSEAEQRGLKAQRYKLERKLENLAKIYAAGVKVIAGTDAISHFGEYVTGLELFCHSCMTPEEALVSATSLAAEAIGLGDKVGMIAKGKMADLLVVEADPLQDISALRKIAAVIKGGRFFTGSPVGAAYTPFPPVSREPAGVDEVLGRR